MQPIKQSNRFNFSIGLLLISLVSIPALMLMIGGHKNAGFTPTNHWLWWAFVCTLVCGFTLSVVALWRETGWGYCTWFQAVIALVTLITYIGWWRRELDFIQGPHDPELGLVAPEASWPAYLVILIMALMAGLLPLGLKTFINVIKSHKKQRLP